MRIVVLVGMLLGFKSCTNLFSPPPAAVRVCSPNFGRPTDPAAAVACDGCRQKYFSGSGLEDMSFDRCVALSTASVRAKLAKDPHHFDAILPKLIGP